MNAEIDAVETRFFTFADGGDPPFELLSGEHLGPVTLAYEQYGELNEARDNAILLFHALSGSQHAGGFNPAVPGVGDLWTSECPVEWWEGFIGPGKALDTHRFCVICVNYLGGCYGSTGPASISPATGKPYGSSFPRITFSDIVDTQVRLLDHLGIRRLRAVIGASVGGMMCLILATRYPDRVGIVIPIASGIGVSPLQRIHNFEQICAIEGDPNFRGGDYYDGPYPKGGLGLARMIGHKTFVSLRALEDRARLEIVQAANDLAWYQIDNSLESYMLHQGSKFTGRFDALGQQISGRHLLSDSGHSILRLAYSIGGIGRISGSDSCDLPGGCAQVFCQIVFVDLELSARPTDVLMGQKPQDAGS